MKLLISFAILVLAAAKPDTNYPSWSQWKSKFAKIYSSQEELTRKSIFNENAKFVKEHNQKYLNGESSYWVGFNQFSDLSDEEFAEQFLESERDDNVLTSKKKGCPDIYPTTLDATTRCYNCFNSTDNEKVFYWQDAQYNTQKINAVTQIKDQGHCGSCWAFAATAQLEGQMCIKGRKDCNTWNGLSTQNILDCNLCNTGSIVEPYCCNGCLGCWSQNAWYYINTQGGVDSWDDYSYTSGDDGKITVCEYNSSQNVLPNGLDSFCTSVTVNDEPGMMQAINEVGPIGVEIDAGSKAFKNYAGGIFSSDICSSRKTNHAVVAVGYGSDYTNGMDFFMIKNSWGTSWGLDGYVKFRRNYNNMCSVASAPYFATIN